MRLYKGPAFREMAHKDSKRVLVEVVCVRRKDVYLRIEAWRDDVLMRTNTEEMGIPGDLVRPAVGVVYEVDVYVDPVRPVFYGNWVETTVEGPTPMAPPEGAPGPGEPLPLLSESGLRRVVRNVLGQKTPLKAVDAVCYLMRRAYSQGTR